MGILKSDRFGSSSDLNLNGHLHYPHDIDRSLNESTSDKIRKYRSRSSRSDDHITDHGPTCWVGYICCLLWINKVRPKGKTCIWVSVRWKTKNSKWGIYMTRRHWVGRVPRDKGEINKREIHECDGWAHDPDTMADPLTPKVTLKPETSPGCHRPLTYVVKKTLHWRSDHCHGTVSPDVFLKLKQKSETQERKVLRTHPNIDEAPTTPKSHTHPSHEYVGRECDPETMTDPPTPKPTHKVGALRTERPEPTAYVPTRFDFCILFLGGRLTSSLNNKPGIRY